MCIVACRHAIIRIKHRKITLLNVTVIAVRDLLQTAPIWRRFLSKSWGHKTFHLRLIFYLVGLHYPPHFDFDKSKNKSDLKKTDHNIVIIMLCVNRTYLKVHEIEALSQILCQQIMSNFTC